MQHLPTRKQLQALSGSQWLTMVGQILLSLLGNTRRSSAPPVGEHVSSMICQVMAGQAPKANEIDQVYEQLRADKWDNHFLVTVYLLLLSAREPEASQPPDRGDVLDSAIRAGAERGWSRDALEQLFNTIYSITTERGKASVSSDVSPPAFVLVWDPELLDEDEYGELVTTLGDLVRSEGGIGIQRINSADFGVPAEAGVEV